MGSFIHKGREILVSAIFSACLGSMPVQGAVVFDWAHVGDAGNAADTTGLGAVDYNFNLATKMVSNHQYAQFLNAVAKSDPHGLYNVAMGSFVSGGINRSGADGNYVYTVKTNFGNKPVNLVSWFDSARFVNWMQNGQQANAATTEYGVYNLSLPVSQITRAVPVQGFNYFLPTLDEWYKGAYYDPTPGAGNANNYWLYATRTLDTQRPLMAEVDSAGNITNPGFRIVNYGGGLSNNWNSSTSGNVTTLGSGGPDSASYYGTYDQAGNLYEWTDTFNGTGYANLGGYFASGNHVPLRSTTEPVYSLATFENDSRGFRIGMVNVVPEPSTTLLILAGAALLRGLRRRCTTPV